MSTNPHLTEEQLSFLKKRFKEFKKDQKLTAAKIAREMNIEKSTVCKRLQQMFGVEYSLISREKCGWNRKLTEEQLISIFEKCKRGFTLEELSKTHYVKKATLVSRLSKAFNEQYKDVSLKNRKPKKILRGKIEEAFVKYKSNIVSLNSLAKNLGIAESSLIDRFKRYFKEEYKRIAKSRRDERKVSKELYIKAFKLYEMGDVSLTNLANGLGIRVSSLAPRFRRLFGKRYKEIAKGRMLDSKYLINRGKVAERLALEYLKIINIELEDVRDKRLIKNSLKRPDFISGENFIEVKSYFIKLSSKKLKGYKEILDAYLNTELKDGNFLKYGIIISLGGFSQEVWKKALEDGVTLVDATDLKRRFEEAKRYDLIKLLENYFLPRCVS